VIGLSLLSSEVSILCARIPDAPTTLANALLITSDVKIGLTWADGLTNGGSAIIDYKVSFD
jgi:hypothetical protein